MKARVFAIILALSASAATSRQPIARHPGDPRLAGVVVVSDFHLYDRDFDFESIPDSLKRTSEKFKAQKNDDAYNRLLGMLSNQNNVTDVIVNGDILHAPTVLKLNPDVRIRRMIDVLLQMSKVTGKPVHFNFGNHDVLMDANLVPIPGFPQRFEEALSRTLESELRTTGRRPDIRLIGAGGKRLGDYKAIYEVKIGGKKIRISHAPFVSTAAINEQAQLFKESNPRAYGNVTQVKTLASNRDGTFHIQSDSHTPVGDPQLNVYNTGMLTLDESLPFPDSTFLVINGKKASHFSIPRDFSRPASPFVFPARGRCNLILERALRELVH